jgi:hypothetical protein
LLFQKKIREFSTAKFELNSAVSNHATKLSYKNKKQAVRGHGIYDSLVSESESEMEIYFKEINKGTLHFEVSVHDNSGIDNPLEAGNITQPPFHVYVTARDEESRKIWKTPVLIEGKIKAYESIDEAVEDARNKIR